MDILDVICKRRSTRRFTPDPISDELIQKLLIAATSAPTAANCQPWEFIVVNDPGVLEKKCGFKIAAQLLKIC